MLREATLASNDDARPYCETSDTLVALGVEHADAPPEVRDAAVVRSRRLPEPDVMRAAWCSLTATDQNRIGTAAITQSFYSHFGAQSHLPLTAEAGSRAEALNWQALNEVEAIAQAALPELYGTDEAEPAWALTDTPLSFPEPFAPLAPITPTKMPPKVRAEAIARSRRIPGLDAIVAAWSRLAPATQDQLGIQAVAETFYSWLTDDTAYPPAERWLTDAAVGECQRRADRALKHFVQIVERSLPELYGNKKRDPAWARLDADPAVLEPIWEASLSSPVQFAIALHRRTWEALRARAAFLAVSDMAEEYRSVSWPAEEAEDEALTNLLMSSCRDRADAKAMVAHLDWYLGARPQHPRRPELHETVGALIAVRLRDLSMILGRDVAGAAFVAVPGVLAGLVAEHRAAWRAYLADPDGLVRGSDRRLCLSGAVGEASGAVLLAPCADRAEAAAFIEHAEWWRAELEAAGDTLADGFTCEAQEIRARSGDLSLFGRSTAKG